MAAATMRAMDLLSTLSGFAVGGLAGVGGGSLTTPLLVLLFGWLPGIWLARRVFATVPVNIGRRLPASMLVPIGGTLVFA